MDILGAILKGDGGRGGAGTSFDGLGSMFLIVVLEC